MADPSQKQQQQHCELAGKSDQSLMELLKGTLQHAVLSSEQQALFEDLALRASSYQSTKVQLQQQQSTLDSLNQQLVGMQSKFEMLQGVQSSVSAAQAAAQAAQGAVNQVAMQQYQLQLTADQLKVSQLQHVQPVQTTQPTQTNNVTSSALKAEKPQNFSSDIEFLKKWLFSLDWCFVTVNESNGVQQVANDTVKRASTNYATLSVLLQIQFYNPNGKYQFCICLYACKQSSSVPKYIQVFRELVIELGSGAPDDSQLMFMFVNNLKPAVKQHVLLSTPNDLNTAMLKSEQVDNVAYNLSTPHHALGGTTPMDIDSLRKQGPQRTLRNMQKTRDECWYCVKKYHLEMNCYKHQSDLNCRTQSPQSSYQSRTLRTPRTSAGSTPRYNYSKQKKQFQQRQLQHVDYSSRINSQAHLSDDIVHEGGRKQLKN